MFRKSNTGSSHVRFNRRGAVGNGIGKPNIEASKYIFTPETVTEVEAELAPTGSFADYALAERLKENIASRGYISPTPIQAGTIQYALDGRDVVGVANTGTGKTAAFLLPIINTLIHDRTKKALIIVPTRELAMQVEDELKEFARRLGISSLLMIGGASMNRQVSLLRANPDVIIATPGRLKDLINQRLVFLTPFKVIVLDEVDRMVDAGFIRDIQYIIGLLPKERQSLFFSATIAPEVKGIISAFLRDPVTVSVKTAETAKSVSQDVVYAKSQEDKFTKLEELLHQPGFERVLVFGRTKWGVEKLARKLKTLGCAVDSIHGNKSQNQRFRALDDFKSGHLQVLVATDIAARGLDISDVTCVINFDEPASYTDYVHRIGRTGRAEKSGRALTFVIG
jgi:superfamily II DNA/RNA helicase